MLRHDDIDTDIGQMRIPSRSQIGPASDSTTLRPAGLDAQNLRMRAVSLIRLPAAWFVASVALAHAVWADSDLKTLLDTHCVDCHNADTTEGEFDLTSILRGEIDAESRGRVFVRMHARVAAGEMPPPDASEITADEQTALATTLSAELDRLAELLRDDPGVVAMTRLTPYEYRNVIRDLSEGVVDDAGRFLPNEGGAGEGFANVGAAQTMTLAQYEKYLDAARDALRHVRVYPVEANDSRVDWRSYPRTAVDAPVAARTELVDEIISWHVAQQQKWGAEHRTALADQLGFNHAAYLEAAHRFHHRTDDSEGVASHASIAIDPTDADSERVALAPAALRKWYEILTTADSSSPHVVWATQWRELVQNTSLNGATLRNRCLAIIAGTDKIEIETEDYAPPYEISFHEAKEEVLEAARTEGRWPFRIDIGDAEELFLVVTSAGDGNRGEYAAWRAGRFIFRDGHSEPWQDAVTVVGANSGNTYAFGFDGEKSNTLPPDAIGAKPPGALKFRVPDDAIVFEVDLTLDENRTQKASIQALVLKEKPPRTSYIRGRYVFGGKKRPISAGAKLKEEQERALRRRNVSEANFTKIGLNAERNVFADWTRTPIEAIGGPWPDHQEDKLEPQYPYHYTVGEVLKNATESDLAELTRLERRLASLANKRDEQDVVANARAVIEPFATRAWRRSVTNGELASLVKLFESSRASGLSFDSSVKSSFLGVLASPHFLFRTFEPARPASTAGETVPLSSQSIASRLSFLLWASLPDHELRQLAEQDRLRDPIILRQQARRMLRDERARSLATDFATQLWGYGDFENFTNPDEKRFPEFTPELRRDMLAEVEALHIDVFQNNRPLTDLLACDDLYATKSLAALYGLDIATRGRQQPIAIAAPPERGGLATTALFLTKTSLPLRTSPVQRGTWVIETLLGRHLPNPPADVPSLSEDATNDAGETIREQLARHRADASCAACHDKIDPIGLSLESFDPIGRLRQTDAEGQPITSEVTTHDGVLLNGPASLKSYLLAHEDEFVDHFNRKLLGYALGRAVHVGDRALLGQMAEALDEQDGQFTALVDVLVTSPQFLNTKVAP